MNKKLIFRILGALSSALIIVSVFVPFVRVTGYSYSLWESNQITNSLYLPIMIIVFGVIGVLFFALNKKTEFAYMSTGAILFFAIMQTVDILNQGVFNTLNVGYYFLVIGAVVTGLMAFLTNLKTKSKKENVISNAPVSNETSMLEQIDKLYNDQNSQTAVEPIQLVSNVVESLPVQPIEQVAPIETVIQEQPKPEIQMVNPVLEQTPQPTVQSAQVNSIPEVQQIPTVEPQQINPVATNPVLEQFNQPVEQQINPVLEQFSQSTVNSVTQEFSEQPTPQPQVEQVNVVPQPIVQQQVSEPSVTPLSNINEPQANNPVVQDFMNPGSTVAPQTTNSSDLDIFGQPINK